MEGIKEGARDEDGKWDGIDVGCNEGFDDGQSDKIREGYEDGQSDGMLDIDGLLVGEGCSITTKRI